MRRFSHFAISVFVVLGLGALPVPAASAPAGYGQAEQAFENGLTVDQRLLVQVLLISTGFGNAVPVEHFNTRTMKALLALQANNGFNPNGQLDKPQSIG